MSELRTYNDLLTAFVAINNKLVVLKESLTCTDVDARPVAISGIQQAIAGYYMGMNSMCWNRSPEEVVRSLGESNLSPDVARKIVEDTWRLGLLTLCHFRIDSLFHNLLRAFRRTPSRSFSKNSTELLALCRLPVDSREADSLKVLTSLRNSLHNNGIHRSASESFTIGTLRYDFNESKAVQCAGWSHSLTAIDAVCDALGALLLSNTVVALPSPVRDDLAHALASGDAVD